MKIRPGDVVNTVEYGSYSSRRGGSLFDACDQSLVTCTYFCCVGQRCREDADKPLLCGCFSIPPPLYAISVVAAAAAAAVVVIVVDYDFSDDDNDNAPHSPDRGAGG